MVSQPFPMSSLEALAVTGPDARIFLQGQLSSDINEVTGNRGQLSAWHDPKGRVLAIFRILPWPDGFLLVMQAELAPAIEKRMRMYVLRAKVQLQAGVPVRALDAEGAAAWFAGGGVALEETPLSAVLAEGFSALRMPGACGWLVAGVGAPETPCNPAGTDAWAVAEIAAGVPEVYPATSGQFVAQMLNLDRLGAVSFTKGCYPGQEVVARAHHLGRVKRRARIFTTDGAPPAPGDSLADTGGTVVRAAASGPSCLVMAVVPEDSLGPFLLADERELVPSSPGGSPLSAARPASTVTGG
jgi:tRNA-modifying protein YgfZ